ncbi:integrase core domain-containing protein [Nitrospira sp. Kam-Ns4a]
MRGASLTRVSDNRSQPTATGFMAAMSVLGIEPVVTSYDNPKGNAETERLIRTIKEELPWLRACTSLEQAREAIRHWITVEYNERDVHSSLGDKSPLEFEAALSEQGAAQALRKMTHSQHHKKCLDKRGALHSPRWALRRHRRSGS